MFVWKDHERMQINTAQRIFILFRSPSSYVTRCNQIIDITLNVKLETTFNNTAVVFLNTTDSLRGCVL